jgi:hypothetical protein
MYELPTANVVTGLEVKASLPKPSTHAPKVSIRNYYKNSYYQMSKDRNASIIILKLYIKWSWFQ